MHFGQEFPKQNMQQDATLQLRKDLNTLIKCKCEV